MINKISEFLRKTNSVVERVAIKRVELKGIHKRYDLDIDFNEDLTILHGQNGTGKSTLIHIIANVANCDFIRFAFIDFNSIKVIYSNGEIIRLFQKETDSVVTIKIEASSGNFFEFSKDDAIKDVREKEGDRYYNDFTPELSNAINKFVVKNNLRSIETSYFPAFRTMLEAWSSQRDDRELRTRNIRKKSDKYGSPQVTAFSRNLFGQFLPAINYPSPLDIEYRLKMEVRDALMSIGRYESSVFSESFVKVFSALLNGSETSSNTDQILVEIAELIADSSSTKLGNVENKSGTYNNLRKLVGNGRQLGELASSAAGALSVYRDALKERQQFQVSTFGEVDEYFDVVNYFLEGKELKYELTDEDDMKRKTPRVGLKFPDGSWSSIKVMSSGERQLLTMLYAVNKMSGNSAVLIDEPELSLHIDWQEDLVGKMMQQLGDRQIIVCTHSPSIAEDFFDYMTEIVPRFSNESMADVDDLDFEEDMI